jgi:membrane protein implicated in regulation of membrane protease activity
MSFLQLITSYPAFLPSVLVGVLLVFWLMAIVGLLDFDSIGPDWIGGGHHHDVDAEGLPDMLLSLGLDRLPFSIVITGVVFFWWPLTLLGAGLLLPLLPLPLWLSGTLLLVLALVAAVLLASVCLRPLKPLFMVHENSARESAIGKRCRILTLSVEENFGQAEVEMGGGTRLTLQVCAAEPNSLRRDAQAVIVDFDAQRRRYRVAEFDP